MARTKSKPRCVEGSRIVVACNGMTWSGVAVPRGTVGTVYLYGQRSTGLRSRGVKWDGFPVLQRNGFPYGIGGDETKDFLPSWARLI